MHTNAYASNQKTEEIRNFYRRAEENGRDLTAIGSSDYHWFNSLGICRTYVFARSNDEPGIVEALRGGRTVVFDRDGNAYGNSELIRLLQDEPITRDHSDYYSGSGIVDVITRTLGWLGLIGLVCLEEIGTSVLDDEWASMDVPKHLAEVLAENRTVRLIEDHIYSVLHESSHKHHYDRRATIYDLLVSMRLYNSVMWGSSPLHYIDFARQAVGSCPEGKFLDAGCGSLLFTAPIYLNCNRQIIAFDQSVAMLKHARERLRRLAGSMPSHIILLQGDLSDLPFCPGRFRTVLSLNVLHQFKEAAALIADLKKLLTEDGYLFLTSLVLNDRFIGDYYLRALHLIKEFVHPRSRVELQEIFKEPANRETSFCFRGNMAFVTTKI